MARVATVEEVTLVGAVVVDVGLVRVIKREDGLALAFSVSFVERVVRAVRRGCTRFDDIALIWLG